MMAGGQAFAADGGPVIGICNGFQVLTEAGRLPGALQKNRGLKFICGHTELRVETTGSALTSELEKGDRLRIPINHFEGSYTCDEATLRALKDEDRVGVRYGDTPTGSVDELERPGARQGGKRRVSKSIYRG